MVRSLPLRESDPLVMPRWAHGGIMGHGVVVRAVIMLLPFVEFPRPRLDGYLILTGPVQHRCAERTKHPHSFRHGHG